MLVEKKGKGSLELQSELGGGAVLRDGGDCVGTGLGGKEVDSPVRELFLRCL